MEQPPSKQENLSAFIAEISALRDEEVEARNNPDPSKWKTGHFLEAGFKPEELTEADREIWEKIKNGSITREEALAHRNTLKADNNFSRRLFGEFIANKAYAVIGNREMDAREKKQNSES